MGTTDWQLGHLLRRAGFGGSAQDLAQASAAGYAATVDRLLDLQTPDGADALPLPDVIPPYFGPAPTADQRTKITQQTADQQRVLTLWWLDRMVATTKPLAEKLTWIWHGLFATSNEKVG